MNLEMPPAAMPT
jgi:hypothetical protein